ncbi:MAG: cation diffusion facilitator family transporter [Gemmataceae bacterium]
MSTAHAQLRWPIYGSIAAAVFTIGLKSIAYYVTGSVGLFSDAAESVVNLLAAVTAFLSLRYAAQPIDAEHTYGHEKIVYFSSGLEGLLIAIAAIGTAVYAVQRLMNPVPLEALGVGATIAIIAALVNFAVARWLLTVGRRYGSIVLEADGQHLMTDVLTSFAVVMGLLLSKVTGIVAVDPIIGIVVAGNILLTGWRLLRQSFDGLMDRALPAAEQVAVREAIERHITGLAAFHALRTRRAGHRRFVDFHLLVPGMMTVRQAHAHADQIEDAVKAALPDAEVTIHIEPIEEPASWKDSELIAIEENNP